MKCKYKIEVVSIVGNVNYAGRVTAVRLGGYDKSTGRVYDKFYPQVEFLEVDEKTGEDISCQFAIVGDNYYENEMEAIKFAIEYRSKTGYTLG